jgi:predicted nucleic-acid-binding protein
MAGKVVDLSAPGTSVPGLIAVDANVVAGLFLVSFFPISHSTRTQLDSVRALTFFQDLQASGGVGVVTPTVFVELVHVLIKGRYTHEIYVTSKLEMLHRYGREFRKWELLHKADQSILQSFRSQLITLKTLLTVNGLMLLEPDLLDPIPSGRPFDEEIIETAARYGIDSSDARILMEAQCCGLSETATFDKDMQRAALDFNVYTWL